MHAATLAWAYTGDPALREKLDRVAADLIDTQEPDGYLGTYVPEQRFGLLPGRRLGRLVAQVQSPRPAHLLPVHRRQGGAGGLPQDGRSADRHIPGEEEHRRRRHARGHGRHQRAGTHRAALPHHRRRALSAVRPLHREIVGRARRAEDHRHAADQEASQQDGQRQGLRNALEPGRPVRTGPRHRRPDAAAARAQRVAGHRRQAALSHRQRERRRAFPATTSCCPTAVASTSAKPASRRPGSS